MSTLYGSDAMGGVINIITKKVPKEAGGSLTIDRTFETDEGRAGTSRYAFLYGGPVTRDKVGLSIRGSWIERGNSTLPNGSTIRGANVTPPGLTNFTIGAKTVWTPTKTATYTFDIENARMDRTMQAGDDGAKDTNNTGLRYDRQRYSFTAENILKAGTWTNTLSYNDTSLHGYSGFGRMSPEPRHNKILVYDTKYVTDAIDNHTIVIGGRWWREMLRGGGEDPTAKKGVPRMTADSTALFVEDTWTLSPKYTLTYGARYDMPDNYDSHLTPRAYLVYKADPRWTVKGGVSTGFRAPTLGESINGIAAFSGGRGGGRATTGTYLAGRSFWLGLRYDF